MLNQRSLWHWLASLVFMVGLTLLAGAIAHSTPTQAIAPNGALIPDLNDQENHLGHRRVENETMPDITLQGIHRIHQ